MTQQEPLEKEEFKNDLDPAKPFETIEFAAPVEPLHPDHTMEHHDGLVAPKIKEYVPLEIGMAVFSIIVLVLVFVGIFSNMWGLMD